jgi:tetratricopeptide (TPR) repeat protein
MADVLRLRLGSRKGYRRATPARWWYARGCELEAAIGRAGPRRGEAWSDGERDVLAAAEHAYRRAIAACPDLADAHNNLGRLCHETARLADAEAAYRRAIECAPDVALYRFNLGVALEDRGAIDDAIAAYRDALERDPQLAEAHFNLAGILGRAGDDNFARLREAVRHLAAYRALISGRRVS